MSVELRRIYTNGAWRWVAEDENVAHHEQLVIQVQTTGEEALVVTGGPGQENRAMVVYPNASTDSYIGIGDEGFGQIDMYEDDQDAKLHMTEADGGQAIISTTNGATLSPSNPLTVGLTISRPAEHTGSLLNVARGDGKAFSVDSKCRPRLLAVTDAPILSDLSPSELAIYVVDNPPNSKLRFVFRDGANDLRVGEVALA